MYIDNLYIVYSGKEDFCYIYKVDGETIGFHLLNDYELHSRLTDEENSFVRFLDKELTTKECIYIRNPSVSPEEIKMIRSANMSKALIARMTRSGNHAAAERAFAKYNNIMSQISSKETKYRKVYLKSIISKTIAN
jgi:hypothetical protein